jgi:hypothetical protein
VGTGCSIHISHSASVKAGCHRLSHGPVYASTLSGMSAELEPRKSSLRNCGKLAPPNTIGAVAQSGERRLCTAEVRGSNPLGSTQKYADLQAKYEGWVEATERGRGLVLQPILQHTSSKARLALFCWGSDDRFDTAPWSYPVGPPC